MSYQFTIVVPVYNEEDNLLRVEAELLAYIKIATKITKILFVNDGSKDKSQSIIEDICSRNPEFSFILFKENRGLSAAIKAGFDYTETEGMFFYPYKFSSFMYPDSNYVAMFIITIFFFLYYLELYENKTYKIRKLILFLLLIGTISRAAIISMIIFYLLFYFKTKLRKLARLIFISFLLLLTVSLFIYISNDVSSYYKICV